MELLQSDDTHLLPWRETLIRKSVLLVTLLLSWAIAGNAAAQSYDVELHVDKNSSEASDGNSGTLSAPLLTIQEAIDRAITNKQNNTSTRIAIHPGTYREFVNVQTYTNMSGGLNDGSNTTPILVEATEVGAVTISGSDVFSNWQTDGSVYYHAWTRDWGPADNPWSCCRQVDEISLRREMVYVDGAWMRQVLSQSEMTDGTFFVDETADRIYLDPPSSVDPNTALTEVAVRERTWWQEYENNVTIRGITFEHAAEPWSDIGGSARFVGTFNLVVEDCRFQWNNYLGIQLVDLDGAALRRIAGVNNGADGWGMFQSKNVLVEDSQTSFNNWRGHLSGFHSWSIGNKILSVHGLTIRRHTAAGNYSRGLWIDYDNSDVVLDELVVEDNLLDGIWLEANQGPVLLQNSTIQNNGDAGLLSANTEQVTLENNVIRNNASSQIRFGGSGGRTIKDFETGASITLYLDNWTIRNNEVVNGEFAIGEWHGWGSSDWDRFVQTYTADYNTYWNEATTNAFEVGSNALDLSGWQQFTGEEANSVFAAPGGSAITADPSSLDFGAVDVGSSSTMTVTISNAGDEDLSVSDMSISGTNAGEFAVASASVSFTLAPGASQNVDVAFDPASAGSKSASLVISNNASLDGNHEVPLVGEATDPSDDEPAITADPSSMEFGDVLIGEAATKIVTISNAGSADLIVSDVFISGTDQDAFRLGEGTPTSFTLAPGGSQDMDVVFEPASEGSKSASLVISNNASLDGTHEVALVGGATDPSHDDPSDGEAEVTYHSPSGGFPLYLGEPVGYNKTRSVFDVSLTDAVGASITITAHEIDAAEEAYISVNGTRIPVPEGVIGNSEVKTGTATIDLGLLVSGTNGVNFETAAEITDGNSYQYRVDALSITVSYGTAEPAITADPSSVEFGSVLVGEIATETLTISNAGSADLNVSDVSISGTDQDAFRLMEGTPTSFTLSAGGSQGIDVVFEPGSAGEMVATLTATSDDPDTPGLEVPLSGTGQTESGGSTAEVTYSVPSGQFPLYLGEPVGYNKTRSVTDVDLTNAQSASFTITADDIDHKSEADIFINGTEIPIPDGVIGNSEVKTGTSSIDLGLLVDGTNDIKLRTAKRISDGLPYQYIVEALAITVTYSTTFGKLAGDVATAGELNDAPGGVPESFSLQGNYPNPFNPTTTITFDLPSDSHVGLLVYDVLGRLAMRVPPQDMKAGSAREISIDAGSLASGAYVYRLVMSTGEKTSTLTGRMTLLK